MFKIKIISVGKNKEKWLEEALNEYCKRLKPHLQIEFIWTKDDDQFLFFVLKETSYVALDPTGRMLNSEKFADYLIEHLQKEGSRLTFVIGGAEGLPEEIKKNGSLLSLSALTFTHQITRLVLIEQIYRAIEIQKGSQYHK